MTPRWCDNCGCQSEHLKFGLCPDCFNASSSYDVRASHKSSDACNCVGTGPSIVKGFLTGAYYWKEGIK